MTHDLGTIPLIPLPELSPVSGDIDRADGIGLRCFGIFEADLSVDFGSAKRAELATKTLELCTVDPAGFLPEGFYRELSIGKRIECLLMLAAGGPDSSLLLSVKCESCGEELELELTLAEISELQREADLVDVLAIDIGGRQVKYRKPLGSDQELWSTMVFRDEREAATGMIGTLAVTADLPEVIEPEYLSAIEQAMDEADPLVNFSCGVNCGECGEPNEYEIDLMETALGMLSRAQNQLVVTVHRLASHYHWSEKEIFAVPDWRRQQYLKLIGAIRK